jgi:hypothetical protein
MKKQKAPDVRVACRELDPSPYIEKESAKQKGPLY